LLAALKAHWTLFPILIVENDSYRSLGHTCLAALINKILDTTGSHLRPERKWSVEGEKAIRTEHGLKGSRAFTYLRPVGDTKNETDSIKDV